MRSHHCIEDLLALARRQRLAPEGVRELDAALRSSLEARLLLEAGQEFDAARCVRPGDEKRVERLAQFAVLRQKRTGRFAPAATVVASRIAAGILACALAATGAWSAVGVIQRTGAASENVPLATPAKRSVGPGARAATTDASVGEPPARALDATNDPSVWQNPARALESTVAGAPTRASSLATSATPPTTTVATVTQSGTPRVTPIHAGARHASPSAVTSGAKTLPDESVAVEDTAARLFAAANLARRARETDRAITLYRRLQEQFPDSAEARDSRLILGKLQLAAFPADALQQFKGYENYAAGAASELTPEALWGQAQALRRLGRVDEERATLERLRSTFPDSPYATVARQRLAEF